MADIATRGIFKRRRRMTVLEFWEYFGSFGDDVFAEDDAPGAAPPSDAGVIGPIG